MDGFFYRWFSVENDVFQFLETFFTRQTRHVSIVPQLCRPETVRRHVHFEDDAVLSEGVSFQGGAGRSSAHRGHHKKKICKVFSVS